MSAAVPHVAFTADIPASTEWPDPPGFKLAELIRRALGEEGVTVSEPENWRDIGWSFTAQLDGKRLEVYFAQAPEPLWLLAIAPLGQPGALGRLLGRKPDVIGPQVRAVAGLIHSVVLSLASVAGVRWCLNGHPADCPSVNEPSLLPWPHEP